MNINLNKESGNQQNQAQDMIPVNGFQQVLEMLQVADSQFRESLLRRIAARDPKLANSLRNDLKKSQD